MLLIEGVGGADTDTVTVIFPEVAPQGPLARYVNVSLEKYAAEFDVYETDVVPLGVIVAPWLPGVTIVMLEMGPPVEVIGMDSSVL